MTTEQRPEDTTPAGSDAAAEALTASEIESTGLPDASRSPAGEEDEAQTPEPVAKLTDRWWFSPTFQVLLGAGVVSMQYDAWSNGGVIWANWLMAALGAAVTVYGAVGLLRAYAELRRSQG